MKDKTKDLAKIPEQLQGLAVDDAQIKAERVFNLLDVSDTTLLFFSNVSEFQKC